MLRAQRTKPHNTDPVFLGFTWIENAILEYRKGKRKFRSLNSRYIVFPEREFAAALMHLYVGNFSLNEIAGMVSTPPAKLAFLRTQIDFMTLVDSLKALFARFFRENLILNEYPLADYASIASEYAVFEELARNQIRVPLFRRMKQLADAISDKEHHELPIDVYDLRTFKKLFSFFVFEECFLQALTKPSFPQLKQVARKIVWFRLGEDYDALDSLLATGIVWPDVKNELKTRFQSLNLL